MRSTHESTVEDESKREHRLRLRVLFAEYRTVLLVAFVVLLALGAWLSYGAYAAPGEETEQRLEFDWTATGEFSHGATVDESTTVYPAGTELADEQLYFTDVTPTVAGAFAAGYETDGVADTEDVEVAVGIDIVYRETAGGDATDDAEVYWSERDELVSATETDVEPGDDVTATFDLNVTDERSTLDSISDEFGASPGETELVLEIEREIEGVIDGRQQLVVDHYQVPISVAADGSTYEFEDESGYDEPYDERETTTVPATPDTARAAGGPLLLVLGLVGLGGLAAASARLRDPQATDRAWLEYRDARAEFEPVTTTVRLPPDAVAGPTATVDTLSALAELGIDLESPVLFDERSERYLVRSDEIVYVFEPPVLESADDATDQGADRGEDTTSQSTGQETGDTTNQATGQEDDTPDQATGREVERVDEATLGDDRSSSSGDAQTGTESAADPSSSSDAESNSSPETDHSRFDAVSETTETDSA